MGDDSDDDTDSDTDTDSDSDEDTTDSDDNSFAAAFAAQKEAENALLDRLEGEDDTEGDMVTEGVLTVSLSDRTMANLWGIFVVFTLVNMTLCVWCHLKSQKSKKRVRFLEDRYDSEIPIENV